MQHLASKASNVTAIPTQLPTLSELDEELNNLRYSVESLNGQLQALGNKLQPIMRIVPSSDKAEGTSKAGAGSPLKCRISTEIQDIRSRVNLMSDVTQYMLDNLAV